MANALTVIRNRIADIISPQRARDSAFSAAYSQAQLSWQSAILGRIRQNGDQLLNAKAGGNLDLWRSLLDDDMAYATFQQRRSATTARPWEVEPGGKMRRDKQAADFIREQVKRVGWDRICDKMLFALWYGYGVGEAIYAVEGDQIVLERIDVPDRGWFGFDEAGTLKMREPMGIGAIDLPERKFWVLRYGDDNDFQPYGVGLAHWVYWPVFFKRMMLPFWLRFLEKFGSPTVLGKVAGGQLDDDTRKAEILAMLGKISSESQVAVPDWLETELLSASGAGGSHEALLKNMDAAITRVILSQTMTTDNGSSRSQSETHKDVRDEVVRADSDRLHESFNNSIVKWLVDWNFPGAAYPTVYRIMDDAEDLNTLADRDTTLKGLGWQRSEQSFKEVYGEGYERSASPEPDHRLAIGGNGGPPLDREFAALDQDAIDRLVARMTAEGDEIMTGLADSFAAALEGVTDPEIARIALLNLVERAQPDAMARLIGKAGLAVRAAEEAGLGADALV